MIFFLLFLELIGLHVGMSSNIMTLSKTSNTIKTLFKSPIADIGPFLEESRYNECLTSLNTADLNGDSNGKLNEEEYAEFIRLYSYGYIDTAYIGLSEFSLAFVSTYVSYSCNPTCTDVEESVEVDTFNSCCRGNTSYISLSTLGSADFFQFCAYTDQYIRGAVDRMASDNSSGEPSMVPTGIPTAIPTNYPTLPPTSPPSSRPSISSAPTPLGQTQIGFSYVINTNGYTADMILSGQQNSISEVLINATTIILLSILSTGDPCPITRRIAEYRPSSPVEIKSVIDIRCPDTQEGNCVLINSIVTVYCEIWEDCYTMQRNVLQGLQMSFQNGCFFRVADP